MSRPTCAREGGIPPVVCRSRDCLQKCPVLEDVHKRLNGYYLIVLSHPVCLEGIVRASIQRVKGTYELVEVASGFYCSECADCGHRERSYVASYYNPQLFGLSGLGTLCTWTEASGVKFKWVDIFRITDLFVQLPNGHYFGGYVCSRNVPFLERSPTIKWIAC